VTGSYFDRSQGYTTFDPELQFDIDRYLEERPVTKEEAVAQAIVAAGPATGVEIARAAIAAAEKWDAGHHKRLSADVDAAIQDEIDHPPASIMRD
jgi:hypothetical protein